MRKLVTNLITARECLTQKQVDYLIDNNKSIKTLLETDKLSIYKDNTEGLFIVELFNNEEIVNLINYNSGMNYKLYKRI